MDDQLLSIGQAASFLGVSQMTLRRWDKSGKLIAIRKGGGTHRYYLQQDLEVFSSDLKKFAYDWTLEHVEMPKQYYCANAAIFLARLSTFESKLMKRSGFEHLFSLIVSVTGEIGNNSFDHNIGKWPDDLGIFFGFDIEKGIVVLADRGIGILQSLRQIRPELSNHVESLRVAFTEIISGRSPENRGNGLKFVKKIVTEHPINLFFRSGDAELRLDGTNKKLRITKSSIITQGCYATLEF